MDKRITRFKSLQAMKADEYRVWQLMPGSERIRAVMDLNLELYAIKGRAADAPRLQLAIVENGDEVETALAQFEAAMFPRSKIAAEASARGLDMCFAADAPREMVNFFADVAPSYVGTRRLVDFVGRDGAQERTRTSTNCSTGT
jgi:hypothetical protein